MSIILLNMYKPVYCLINKFNEKSEYQKFSLIINQNCREMVKYFLDKRY